MAYITRKLGWYLAITRPINIVIVAITQYIVYHFLLLPIYASSEVSPVLDGMDITSLIIVTCLCLAIGNIYNDLKDQSADLINKPEKTYIRKDRLSQSSALFYLYSLLATAILIVTTQAIRHRLFHFTPYFAFVLIALYTYSPYFKKTPFVGNILVAGLSTLVAGIIYMIEYKNILYLPSDAQRKIHSIFQAYLSFSFVISLFRELVKDLQDIEGDKNINATTLPILIGEKASKTIGIILGIILMATYLLWLYIPVSNPTIYIVILCLSLLAPTILIISKLFVANSSFAYGRVSTYIKYVMGLALILFIYTITA